ncbi:hypothetical protein UNDKW_1646 [Undibacterium sp. KW1]|uniref:HNH endonuclease signature motif containing protein n=1 Tax=Undibacterium sp. KW1 TaxID=2058624 RepID=UPI001331CFA8|nr:HNH endonuclease signature motif containing protein [Undibacterium sp. KW1]BBB59919.1 hypothetical protein UNDKW_1646 [Undibacterium sp. KW1]
MNIKVAALVVVVLSFQSAALTAAPARSSTVKRDFQRQNPCPSTGKTKGACPGYVKDHIKPLACGGADAVENMQWQMKEDAKKKDRIERKNCMK